MYVCMLLLQKGSQHNERFVLSMYVCMLFVKTLQKDSQHNERLCMFVKTLQKKVHNIMKGSYYQIFYVLIFLP